MDEVRRYGQIRTTAGEGNAAIKPTVNRRDQTKDAISEQLDDEPITPIIDGTADAMKFFDDSMNEAISAANPTEAEMHYSQNPASPETVRDIRDEIAAANNQQDGD